MISKFLLISTISILLSSAYDKIHQSTSIDHYRYPLLYYGYKRHSYSILDSIYSLKITRPTHLYCQTQLNVAVHKALLYFTGKDGLQDTAVDCTEISRGKCLGKEQCLLGLYDCKNATIEGHLISSTSADYLEIEYTCEPAKNPRPLFDGLRFIEGVSSQFLIIPFDDCDDPLVPSTQEHYKKIKNCKDSPYCKYVTGNDATLHTDNYIDKKNDIKSHVYMKPDSFKLPGYTVLLNYTGICKHPNYVQEMDFYGVARLADSNEYTFCIGYKPSKLFNLDPSKTSWLCKGKPTIVPMPGHIVAIPAGY